MKEQVKQTEHFNHFNIIVFGGEGDLAMRKIYPAMFHRFVDGQFTEPFNIIAVTRKEQKEQHFFAKLKALSFDTQTDSESLSDFFKNVRIICASSNSPEGYSSLSAFLKTLKNYQNIYYFSTPSSAFGEIASALKQSGLIDQYSKVVLEKPLGYSLASSNAINEQISAAFKENQIYRIDHYLGKETVQNLMVLRFTNNLFEKAWNADNIDNIQITVSESLGVENRAAYYDNSGALLDMVQNHLLQLLCLVAMEPPYILDADQVRGEKLKVLRSLRLFDEKSVKTDTIKGQYADGSINGKAVDSYLNDIQKSTSKTETFVAIKAFVDNWRWKNMPFYLRTGKRMKKRYSEIVINFKSVRHNIFPSQEKMSNNKLIIRLQPEERIELVQMTKIPGPGGYRYKPISLKLDYIDSFKERFPDAYERLIIDVIRGNQTLFMSQKELEAAWIWIESITNNWKKTNQTNVLYEAGSWGPGDLILQGEDTWVTKENDEAEAL